ncbi:hypothetical protein SB659_11080 [Arthrobacter sp. SIMBA_036]|uniref:hypothetical protein n=1 Tax=Arthrobacter sp. SIMBA_036 TaxID=3085778 RepID=UPI00397B79F7
MTVQSTPTAFADRHIGARRLADVDTMLKAIGYDSVDVDADRPVRPALHEMTLPKGANQATQRPKQLRPPVRQRTRT